MDMNIFYHHHLFASIIIIIHSGTPPTKCMYVRMYHTSMDMNIFYHHHLFASIIIIIHSGTPPTKLSPLYAGAVFPRSAKTISTTIPSINVNDDDDNDNGGDVDYDDDDGGGVDHDDHDDGAFMGMSIIDDYNNSGKSDEKYVDSRRMINSSDDRIGIIDDNNSRDGDQQRVRNADDVVDDNSISLATTTSLSISSLSSINDELNYITLMERYADAQNHR
jgi:hypothetical protein